MRPNKRHYIRTSTVIPNEPMALFDQFVVSTLSVAKHNSPDNVKLVIELMRAYSYIKDCWYLKNAQVATLQRKNKNHCWNSGLQILTAISIPQI